MKKRYIAVMMGIGVLVLSGCSKKEEPVATSPTVVVESSVEQTEAPTETPSSYTNPTESTSEDLFGELSDNKDTTLVKSDSDVFKAIQEEDPDKYDVQAEYVEVENEDYLKAVEATRESPISESVETDGLKALAENPEEAADFERIMTEDEVTDYYANLSSQFPGLSEMDKAYILDLEGVDKDSLADYCKRWSDPDVGMRTGESYKKAIAYKVAVGELERDWCIAQGADGTELDSYIESIQTKE